jgi:hypothetical protein
MSWETIMLHPQKSPLAGKQSPLLGSFGILYAKKTNNPGAHNQYNFIGKNPYFVKTNDLG